MFPAECTATGHRPEKSHLGLQPVLSEVYGRSFEIISVLS
ncbi:hypothetical protein PCLA_03r0741 [Pseudomonas citronellolis]|nr:hypothetical protein PCLA_03r0741 [Pseudomonas citronellolis]